MENDANSFSNYAVDYVRYGKDMAGYAAKVFRARNPNTAFRVFFADDGACTFVVVDPEYLTEAVSSEFRRFKPAAAAISLATDAPAGSVEIPLQELLSFCHEMSTIHTIKGLCDVLSTRHPDIRILEVLQDSDLALTLIISNENRNADLTALWNDLKRLPWKPGRISIDFRHDDDHSPARTTFDDDVFFVGRRSRRPRAIQRLNHVREDEERWYDSFEKAAIGELSSELLPAAIGRSKRTVFLPSAEFETLPDLRNYFLLYDHVLMEVPLTERFHQRHDGVSIDDFAEAAARGRLQLLVTQPEERLPLRLLEAVGERSDTAIIGRRAGSTFAMSVYAERLKFFEAREERESLGRVDEFDQA